MNKPVQTPEILPLYSENTISIDEEDSLAFIKSLNVSKETNPKFMEAATNYKKIIMTDE